MIEHNQVIDATAHVEKEPDDYDWGEGASNFGCSKGLNSEEEDEDGASYSDDCSLGMVSVCS